MQYLLIKTDGDKFFNHEVDPEEFMTELRHVLSGARLEQITNIFGSMEYDYLVIGGAVGIRQKLLSVQGIAKVLIFETKPAVG